jgi:hypothetical protein
VVGRQIYLIIIGSQTIVEVSHETISPEQTIQVVLAHQPGRVPTQALEITLVCRQTVRHKGGGRKGSKYITTVLHEAALGTYSGADIPPLQLGSSPVTMAIPEEARLSTDPGHYPTIEWQIEVTVKVAQVPDFRLTFPFKVT